MGQTGMYEKYYLLPDQLQVFTYRSYHSYRS